MPVLVVNVDHVATLRQARGGREPEPVAAAHLAELHGAQGIIVHLREDRRHIQDRDLELLAATIASPLHLEMAATAEISRIALKIKPHMVCLVPEKRQELTTEGGLILSGREEELKKFLLPIKKAGIKSSLFIEAKPMQIQAARSIGVDYVELHTGHYAEAKDTDSRERELGKIIEGVRLARSIDLKVNLGHGLNYMNILPFGQVPGIAEFSIGHSIMARAILVGLPQAVQQMAGIIAGFKD